MEETEIKWVSATQGFADRHRQGYLNWLCVPICLCVFEGLVRVVLVCLQLGTFNFFQPTFFLNLFIIIYHASVTH